MKFRLSVASGAIAAACLATTPMPASAQGGAENPYLGQLMPFGGNFCPRGWSEASGSLLPIAQNTALFSLFGTMYGGDGRTTFGLPDLRGRSAVHLGNGPGLPNPGNQGTKGGSTSFTLATNTMPAHNHTGGVAASPGLADTDQPVRNSFARSADGSNVYQDSVSTLSDMHPNLLRVQNTGGGQAYQKISPSLAIRWCVAIVGQFPSRP